MAVKRDGQVYFGSDQVAPASLTQKIKDKLATRTTNKTVFLRADARARYKAVAEVVDDVRSAGVDALGLLTESRKATPPKPGGM